MTTGEAQYPGGWVNGPPAPRDRKRVLQIGKFYPPHMGGIETHLQALCEELQCAVDVHAIVANTTRKQEEEWVDGIRVTRLGTALNLAAAPLCPALRRRLRGTSAELVHVHLPNPGAVLAYLASGHSGPLVVSYHSDVVRQRILERFFRPFLLRFLARADAIIVATPNHIDSSPILRRFRSRCTVIPYGIKLDQANDSDESEVQKIREEYGPRIVLGVGRLVYYKGFEFLIRAMRGLDAQLVLIGEGPMRADLEAEVLRNGVRDRVRFLGRVDDLTPFYKAADVFVLPSVARSEAFGIVQLEAMACGTPVINTQIDSGAPFVSLHNVSGLTVPPANEARLRDAIARVLDDSELRAELGQAARRRVEEEFAREVMAGRTLELYGTLLGGSLQTRSTGSVPRQGSRPSRRAQVS